MKILDKFKIKLQNRETAPSVTIAFLGDSITEGCFEIYTDKLGNIQTCVDAENVYHNKLKRIFSMLYPTVPLNIINAGISGNCSWDALKRIESDVIRHSPDLCVICFGVNDAFTESGDNEKNFYDSVKAMVKILQNNDIETILMTSPMNCTKVSCRLSDPSLIETAKRVSEIEKSGTLERFANITRKVSKETGVPLCDCYGKWKTLYNSGVDVTSLLANYINHPNRDMHNLFAYMLTETIFEK